MTEDQKQVFDLYKSGMTLREVADKLGITYQAAKGRYKRAKAYKDADPAAIKAAEIAGSNAIPNAFWVKTDTHSIYYKTPQGGEVNILDRVADAFNDIKPSRKITPRADAENDLLAVYPLYDMHIGMLAWARETRGQDYDLELAAKDLMQSVSDLMHRTPDASKALVILGGDTLHVNDHYNETPASKHHQDADGRFEKIVDVAIKCISQAIEMIAENHKSVDVIILRGNHDETSHIVLKAALKQRYRETENINFPLLHGMDKSEIYWYQHGKSLIAAHHGDKAPPQRLAMIVADKCPFWSDTRHRVILTGHLHNLRVQDFAGVTHYTLRAFAPPDAYGSMFGGVRGLSVMTFCNKSGLVNVAYDPIERG